MTGSNRFLQVFAGGVLAMTILAGMVALGMHAPWVLLILLGVSGLAALVAAALVFRGRPAIESYRPAPLILPPPWSPWEQRKKGRASRRLLVFGMTGDGKTACGLSILQTVAGGRQRARILAVSPFLREQFARAARHSDTERTPGTYQPPEPGQAGEGGQAEMNPVAEGEDILAPVPLPLEQLVLKMQRRRVEFLFWAGEDLYLRNGWIDVDGLIARMRDLGARRLLLTVNPFRTDSALAYRALCDLAREFNEKGFSLPRSIELAAKLLWGIDRKGLVKLGVGYPRLADWLREARLRFEQGKHPVREQFLFDGIPPAAAARAHDMLERIALTVHEQSIEVSAMREATTRVGNRTIAVGTHADLLPFLRTIDELDLRKAVQGLFPAGRSLRSTQVVLQGSVRLELSDDPKEPVWKRGPSEGAGELLESVATELDLVAEADRPAYQGNGSFAPANRLPAHSLLPSTNGHGAHAKKGGWR